MLKWGCCYLECRQKAAADSSSDEESKELNALAPTERVQTEISAPTGSHSYKKSLRLSSDQIVRATFITYEVILPQSWTECTSLHPCHNGFSDSTGSAIWRLLGASAPSLLICILAPVNNQQIFGKPLAVTLSRTTSSLSSHRWVWSWGRGLMTLLSASPLSTRARVAARAPSTCGTGMTKSSSLTSTAPSPSKVAFNAVELHYQCYIPQ